VKSLHPAVPALDWKMNFRRIIYHSTFFVLIAGLVVLFTSCRSTPKIDWNSRIGHYTYDQAVAELGPPDKSAQLTDGRTVVEWVTGYRRGSSVNVGTGVFGGRGGVSVGQTVGGGTRAQVLRLTFDQENRLMDWTRR
jgi:hypothetical protein